MSIVMLELTDLEKETLLKLTDDTESSGVSAMEEVLLNNPQLMLNMLKKIVPLEAIKRGL